MTTREAILANPTLTDAQVLALLKVSATNAPIDRGRVAEMAITGGTIERLRAVAANTGNSATVRQNAQRTVDMILGGPPTLSTHVPGSVVVTLFTASLTQQELAAVIAIGGGMVHGETTLQDVSATRAQIAADDAAATRQAAYDVIDNAWGIEAYGVGRAELLRRLQAGESMPTVDELLAFVVTGRGD